VLVVGHYAESFDADERTIGECNQRCERADRTDVPTGGNGENTCMEQRCVQQPVGCNFSNHWLSCTSLFRPGKFFVCRALTKYTRLPGQDPLHWVIREVTPPNAATIELSLDGAALSFEWRFVGLADGRTRLTQRIVLKGEKAQMGLWSLRLEPAL
jgi:hypothetical protein